jgi:hypothetical protein
MLSIVVLFANLLSAAPPAGWELVGVTDGVEVARQTVEGSPLFAFRGESVTDVHISVLSGLLLNDPLGPEWVDLMYLSYLVERQSPTLKIIRQGYDLPWPVGDRDYILRQEAHYDASTKTFTLNFQSVPHSKEPANDCCIRAEATRTYWKLQTLENGHTHLMVEVITDPKGLLPAWLINLIQEDWPHNTINGLINRSKKGGFEADPFNKEW